MTWTWLEEWCWGSTDRRHRFWLVLHSGDRVCINCHEVERRV